MLPRNRILSQPPRCVHRHKEKEERGDIWIYTHTLIHTQRACEEICLVSTVFLSNWLICATPFLHDPFCASFALNQGFSFLKFSDTVTQSFIPNESESSVALSFFGCYSFPLGMEVLRDSPENSLGSRHSPPCPRSAQTTKFPFGGWMTTIACGENSVFLLDSHCYHTTLLTSGVWTFPTHPESLCDTRGYPTIPFNLDTNWS